MTNIEYEAHNVASVASLLLLIGSRTNGGVDALAEEIDAQKVANTNAVGMQREQDKILYKSLRSAYVKI